MHALLTAQNSPIRSETAWYVEDVMPWDICIHDWVRALYIALLWGGRLLAPTYRESFQRCGPGVDVTLGVTSAFVVVMSFQWVAMSLGHRLLSSLNFLLEVLPA